MATGWCMSNTTTGGATTTSHLAIIGASATGTPLAPGLGPSDVSWIYKDGRTVLVKCLLFALFYTLNKMASVLKCTPFCFCSLHLEGIFPQENVLGLWPDILTLIRGLNKIIQALTLFSPRLKCYLLDLCVCLDMSKYPTNQHKHFERLSVKM